MTAWHTYGLQAPTEESEAKTRNSAPADRSGHGREGRMPWRWLDSRGTLATPLSADPWVGGRGGEGSLGAADHFSLREN